MKRDILKIPLCCLSGVLYLRGGFLFQPYVAYFLNLNIRKEERNMLKLKGLRSVLVYLCFSVFAFLYLFAEASLAVDIANSSGLNTSMRPTILSESDVRSDPQFLEIIRQFESAGFVLKAPYLKITRNGINGFITGMEDAANRHSVALDVRENEIQTQNHYIIYIPESGSSDVPVPIFVSVVQYRNEDLPKVSIKAGDKILKFDFETSSISIEQSSSTSEQVIALDFGLDDLARLGLCFLDFLGLRDWSSFANVINNFCHVGDQIRTIYFAAVGIASCIGISAGCPMALTLLTEYAICGVAEIAVCMRGEEGNCTSPISIGQTVSGTLSSSCTSNHRSGRYAGYYNFSVGSTTQVTIDLTASFDTYLYLLDSNGNVITYDDDSGDGYNSRIVRTLQPGNYTLEATSYGSGVTGSFNLSLR